MHNILICDDDKDIVAALRIYLSTEGYRLFEAGDGRAAVESVRANDIHLVLMDVMMPGTRNGLDVCRSVKKDAALRHTKVVMLTARGQSQDREAGFAAGADDYLVKPFSTLQVLETLRRVESGVCA